MFKPNLKNNWSLVILAIIGLIVYLIAQNSYVEIQSTYYEDTLAAAQKMNDAMNVLKSEFTKLGLNIDKMNDPNETGLVGTNVSSITTSRGPLTDRLLTLNPNLAAAFIDLLKKCDLNAGDYVAVGLTSANPGANLALFSALEVLKITPIVITSVGSATFGANRENFTWLDMEKILYQNNIISFYSEYATMGGTNDLGRGLPPEGRNNIILAIERNNRVLLDAEDLNESIEYRIETWEKSLPAGEKYKAFINIGAGVGNVGSLVNAKLIHTGIQRRLGERNFKEPGALMYFAKRTIPVIHIYDIKKLINDYNLPTDVFPMPQPGTGHIYSHRINNIKTAIVCWILLVGSVVAIVIFDRHDRKFTTNLIDPDEDL
jgi:poly-gamma-glutamate system protein